MFIQLITSAARGQVKNAPLLSLWGSGSLRQQFDLKTKYQKKLKGLLSPYFSMVPEVGLEPTRCKAHDFESRSSANSDTLAGILNSNAKIIIVASFSLVKIDKVWG